MISVQLDHASDFWVTDNRHSAVLKRDNQQDILLSDCVHVEPYTIKEYAPTGAQVYRSGALFTWPWSESPSPPLGSVVVDDGGNYWTIWQIKKTQHTQLYDAFCLNLSMIGAPWNNVLLLKASYSEGGAGEAKAEWHGLFSSKPRPRRQDHVLARIQPSEETAILEFGSEFTKETYRVYFEHKVPLEMAGGEYRIVDSNNYRYRVTRYFDEERIDRLPCAIAVRVTEGSEYWVPVHPEVEA
jgi:hypothetical protein